MEKLISCCGLDCATCGARLATIANDDSMRAKIAEQWRVQHNSPELTAEMINCTGCRVEGVKLGYCSVCEIRSCVQSKSYDTCADCERMETFTILGKLVQIVPSALYNLKSLN